MADRTVPSFANTLLNVAGLQHQELGMDSKNLFISGSKPGDDEWTELLAQSHDIRIERIVSHGTCSPPGFWYNQDLCEWVALLRGSAGLRFEDEPGPRTLKPGDYVRIDANRRHRVEWTSTDEPAIWLAVHFDPSGEAK